MSMSRSRPLPPDIFRDEDLIPLDPLVKLTAIGLRLHADDEGRESTTLWMLRAAIWPGHPEFTDDVLTDHLLLLDQVGYIGIYSAGERTYYQVRVWPSLSHPAPSKFPKPPLELFRSLSRGPLETFSAGEREEGGSEGESEPGRRSGVPPSPFCKLHPHGTTANCRHCGTARLDHQQFIELQRVVVDE